MNSKVSFSILMANHNREKYITEAIQSIINQTFTDFELLICDDNSSDNSVKIIKEFQAKDNRIILFENKENKGAGFTKSFLASQAKGTISAFFDSDDFLDKNTLKIIFEAFQKHPTCALIYSNHYVCDENLNVIKLGSSREIPKTESHLTYFGISHFAAYKTEKYHQTEGINPLLPKAVDQDLYYKVEETGTLHFIDCCLYFYRHNAESISLHQHQTQANAAKFQVMKDAILRRKQQKNSAKNLSENILEIITFENENGKNYLKFIKQNFIKNTPKLIEYICYKIRLFVKKIVQEKPAHL